MDDAVAAHGFLDAVGNRFLLLSVDAQRLVLGRLLWAHAFRSGDAMVAKRLLREVVQEALRCGETKATA
jgi:hypothetical protein